MIDSWRMERVRTDRTPPIRFALAAATALVGIGLAGCSGGSLLGNNETTQSAISTPAQQPAQPVAQTRVGLAPIVGAPDAINKQLTAQLAASLGKQRVAVANAGEKGDYTLRGYVVAAKEKSGIKVSYIWDVTDQAGKRVNRIQGEEFGSGGDPKDPWSAVTEQLTQTISDKTAASLSSSLASLPASASNANAPVGVGAPTQPLQTASLPTSAATSMSRTSAGTQVTGVTGAPGDGNSSLMSAMQGELTHAGISSSQPGQPSYIVVGKVTVGAGKDGKQSIRIDWKVSDPSGAVLATVSQNNEIASGALDGAWGSIANDAAQGAVVKIKTLIEENQTGASASRGPVRREVRSKT